LSRCNVDEASERVSGEHWEAANFCGASHAIACLLACCSIIILPIKEGSSLEANP